MAKRALKTVRPSPRGAKQAKKSPKKAIAGTAPRKMARKTARRVKDPLPGGDPFEL
jgi:hypothetical protein